MSHWNDKRLQALDCLNYSLQKEKCERQEVKKKEKFE